MKKTHYDDGSSTDTDILVAYRREFPDRRTSDIYQMMAELVVNDREAQELYQELSQQLRATQSRNGRTPPLREPPVDHGCGAESVRDHLGADNIIRHMHRNVASAYNRGPPVDGDPYLGTGLNPAHVTGVVSPNDGQVPEMACCGRPFERDRSQKGNVWKAPLGCWIRLDPRQPEGELVRYQTWFTTKNPAALWKRIALGGSSTTLTDATVTGTAFVHAPYYQGLDKEIRKLVEWLAPPVFGVYRSLLESRFSLTSGFSRLEKPAQDDLKRLVALVQRYNAPQLGACHHERTITVDYLDEHVFFISVGREEFRAGRLVTEVAIGNSGVNAPLIPEQGFSSESFENTANALQLGGVDSIFVRIFRVVAALIAEAENQQKRLEEAKHDFDIISNRIKQSFISVGLPNVFAAAINNISALYNAAEQLSNQLKDLLSALPKSANQWISEKQFGEYPVDLFQDQSEARKTIAAIERKVLSVGDAIDVFLQPSFFTVFETTADDIAAIIAKEVMFNTDELRLLPQVQAWARATVIYNKLESYELDVREKLGLDKAIGTLRDDAVATVNRLAAEVAIPRPQNLLGGRKRVSLIPSTKIPVDVKNWTIAPGFVYYNESCTYDSLFVFLFWIPNQWLRNQVFAASSLEIEPQCEPSMATMIHKTMLKTIEYAEREKGAPIQKYDNLCTTRTYWETCLPTSGLSGRFSNPIQLLSKLFEFYRLDRNQATLFMTKPYGKWAPNYENRRTSDLRMFAIVREEPETRDKEFSMTDPYKIQLTNGEFSMVSCILYTNGHWHACIRNPKNDLWYRMLDTGEPTLLSGTIPREIDRITQTDPARKDEAKYGQGGAKYEPAAWLYYRTEDLRAFYDSLSETNNFPDEPFTDTSGTIVNLFGYTENPTTEEKYYIDEHSAFENVPSTRTLKMGILTSLLRVATEPKFDLEQINRLIIDPLRYFLNSGKYETLRLPPGVLESFKPQAERVKLLVQGHWAPAWESGFPAIQPPDDGTDKISAFRSLSSAWCGALFWLLAKLRKKQMPASVNPSFNINVVVNKEWKLVNK